MNCHLVPLGEKLLSKQNLDKCLSVSLSDVVSLSTVEINERGRANIETQRVRHLRVKLNQTNADYRSLYSYMNWHTFYWFHSSTCSTKNEYSLHKSAVTALPQNQLSLSSQKYRLSVQHTFIHWQTSLRPPPSFTETKLSWDSCSSNSFLLIPVVQTHSNSFL